MSVETKFFFLAATFPRAAPTSRGNEGGRFSQVPFRGQFFGNKLLRLTTLSPKFRTRHGRYTVCPTNALTFAAVGSKTGKSPSAASLLASFGRRCELSFDISRTCTGAANKTTTSQNSISPEVPRFSNSFHTEIARVETR